MGRQPAQDARVSALPQVPVETAPEQTAPRGDWPEIFGRTAPEPSAPVEPEPEVTVFNHSYVLKGLFANSTNAWAIVSDPGGEYLLRAGDELPGGAVVEEITEEGVWLDTGQGRELIAFVE